MKLTSQIFRLFAAAAVIALPAALTSCSDDDGPEYYETNLDISEANLQYNSDGIWQGWNKPDNFKVGQFELTHGWDGYPFGFTPSRSSDTQDYGATMFDHQFTVVPGQGSKGPGSPFIVGNQDVYQEGSIESGTPIHTCKITIPAKGNELKTFYPKSIKVTNTCYAYYTMLNGNSFAKKFEEEDWFLLTITGQRTNGGISIVEVYLADCKKNTDPSTWFVTDWSDVDLSPLGEVVSISFALSSSDTGAYGMNTPAYFAFDDLEVTVKN